MREGMKRAKKEKMSARMSPALGCLFSREETIMSIGKRAGRGRGELGKRKTR